MISGILKWNRDDEIELNYTPDDVSNTFQIQKTEKRVFRSSCGVMKMMIITSLIYFVKDTSITVREQQ